MNFDDSRYINASEGFGIYMSTKLSLAGNYDISKYGLYAEKWGKMFLDPQNARYVFEQAVNKYQTEARMVTYCAGNFIIDPNLFITDMKDDHYIRLRKFNAAFRHFETEFKNLVEHCPNVVALIKSGDILKQFLSGDISPELFVCLDTVFEFDKLLANTSQGFAWGLLKQRLTNYKSYVTVAADRKSLSSCVAKILKQL
jgi:hypothetical protein